MKDRMGAALAFLGSWLLLVRTAAPSYYLDDSAETCAAAALVGVPHPPGYPLYTLLSSLFLRIPVGETPFRLNLMAAFWASACAALLYRLLRVRIGAAFPL